MSETDAPSKIQILYIAGYGFSGSTILETLLSCHEEYIGMGELVGIPRELNASYTNTLMERNPECAVIYKNIRSSLGLIGEDLESISELNREEHLLRRPRNNPEHRYTRFWQTFLRAASTNSGCVIIDSSKTTMQHARRPQLLQQIVGVEVSIVHIIRHPKSILARYQKIRERLNEKGSPFIGEVKFVLRTAISWMITNLWTLRLTRKMDRSVGISFEELCEHPVPTIRRIEKASGISLAETVRHLEENLPLPGTCGIAGNIRVKKEGEELKFRPSTKKIPSTGFFPALVSRLILPIYSQLTK